MAAAHDEGVLASSAGLGWRGLVAELHRLGPDHQPEHLVQTHRLMVHTGAPARFEFREGGGAWRARVLRPGDLSLVAHGQPNEPRWHDRMEFLAIGLDPGFAATAFGDALSGQAEGWRPARGEADPTTTRLAGLAIREMQDPAFNGALFGQTLALAFARHLAARQGAVRQGAGVRAPRGRLAGAQLGRVLDHLHANLSGDVGLDALAAEAGVSPFHFARLFRAATGLSPHQFVLHLRIDHSRRLIRSRPGLTLAAVAAASGFFDQAHFTKTFKRLTRTSPSAFAAA